MLQRIAPFVLSTFVGFLAGCGGGGAAENYASARLEGAVSLDGTAIDSGSVQFVPADTKAGPVVQASIMQGRYVAPKVPLGKVTAMITPAQPEAPKEVSSDYKPPKTQIIPDRYKSGIQIEVKGDNADQDFALSSKK